MPKEKFDKKDIYQDRIAPHVREILLECTKNRIPVFISFAVADNGKETEYVNEFLSSENVGVRLADDHGYRHVCVMNGFYVSPKPEAGARTVEVEAEAAENVGEAKG